MSVMHRLHRRQPDTAVQGQPQAGLLLKPAARKSAHSLPAIAKLMCRFAAPLTQFHGCPGHASDYMACCRFSFYLLVPAHTPAYSLLANAMLMCRFGPPLAFNFMAALAMPPSKHDSKQDVTNTVFYDEFGRLMMKQVRLLAHMHAGACVPSGLY